MTVMWEIITPIFFLICMILTCIIALLRTWSMEQCILKKKYQSKIYQKMLTTKFWRGFIET